MNHFLQKLICCTLILCSFFLIKGYGAPAWPAVPDIQAEAGIVIDADSGAVLGEKNADAPYPPASITKLLTALVVLEHAGLDDKVSFSDRAIQNVEADGGNKLNVAAGDTLTVEECLYSLLMQSCNQVANALAEHVAGTQEAFVELMNEKALSLGCRDSHFDNPSGLNGDTQYVTARDMALIARAAFNRPEIVKISSSLSYEIPPTINNPDGITIYGENKLILNSSNPNSPYCYPPVKGGKTGYLKKAGNTLATYAKQDERRLISIILKGKPEQYYLDGKALLEFGFANFDNFKVPGGETSPMAGMSVTAGGNTYEPSELSILPGTVTLPKGASIEDTDREPVTAFPGDHPKGSVAFLQYTYQGKAAGGAYVTAVKPVEQAVPSGNGVEGGRQGDGETNGHGGKREKKGDGFRSLTPVFFVLPVLMALLLAGGGLVIRARKREEKRKLLRMEQRRRRLRQEGVSEAEFQRLLDQRRKGSRKRRK